METHPVKKIVSGGQTGVDRGALDAAIFLGLAHGGWCPLGRLAEDGCVPQHYQLRETESAKYPVRTERNVVDSDGTLILFDQELQGGTSLTLRLAEQHAKPVLSVDLAEPRPDAEIIGWLKDHDIAVLNVAGPRESSKLGVADAAREFLVSLFRNAEN